MLFQAALAATCHNPLLKSATKRLNKTKRLNNNGKPHKPVVIAIARRLITIANAVLKTATPWQHQTGA